MSLNFKKIAIDTPPVNTGVERIEINSNNLNNFDSSIGLIGKHIYIPKLQHSLSNAVKASPLQEIKHKCSVDYPHIEKNINYENNNEIYKLISGLMELRFLNKKEPFKPIED